MSILRNITIEAKKMLENPELLLFIGARQSGKTTILKQLQEVLNAENQITYFLNLEDPEFLGLLNESPKNLFKIFTFDLSRKTFVFIDEIQYLKNPTNFLKYIYDEYQGKIKLLVSGSSAFYLDQKFHDSLSGRKKIFPVRTLSFKEFLRFKNEEKLSQLNFSKLSLTEKEKVKYYYDEFLIYGGYPKVVLAPLQEKKEILNEIGYSYVKKDIFEAGVRQEETFYKFIKILAGGVGGLVNFSEISATLGATNATLERYFYILRKSFHISLVRPFYKNIRKELTKMPKVYFNDLGLRNFFIGNLNSPIIREDKGALMENAVFRQLIERYDESEIRFWRTTSGNEVDFIAGDKNAFEAKFNAKQFDRKKYMVFSENYPEIDLKTASYEIPTGKRDSNALYLWQI
ncbi:MAG: ATP-binding protein [Candidatus Peregrinibacteria bacterium]|nr:ATP-binding protein [Candidatus Peregrinibacteria bacterium]